MAPLADVDFLWPTKECYAYGHLGAMNGSDSTQYIKFEKATYQTVNNSMLLHSTKTRGAVPRITLAAKLGGAMSAEIPRLSTAVSSHNLQPSLLDATRARTSGW